MRVTLDSKRRLTVPVSLASTAPGDQFEARFDADDICMPDRFARQVAFLQAHPDHGIVGSGTRFIDTAGAPASNAPIVRPTTHEAMVANLEDGPQLCHSAIMVRRDLVRQVGGYRPAYVHAEDQDLWLRLSRMTRLHNLPECLLEYRISPGQISSRHLIAQTRNAAIAWRAHCAVLSGKPDPTDGLETLPPLDALDELLGPGSAAYVRARIVARALYAPEALARDGWDALLGHIAEHGPDPQLWRVAARMLRAGRPFHAARTALQLVRHAA